MPSKERIAVIDDDINLRRTLADILTHYGYEPRVYPNGRSAIEAIPTESVAVALLDLRLEDYSGLEVLRFIRDRSPNTACIILTGHASQDSAIEAVNAGAYSYFLKPVNIEQLLVTIRRALEKRQTDLALMESERHYQALANVSPVGIFRTDAAGLTTYVNPRWSLISGYPMESAMGMGWLEAVHPEDRPGVRAGWEQVVAAQAPSVGEYRFIRPDGGIVSVIGQAMPEFNAEGEFVGHIGTITDITTRKVVEDALQRSEEQYKLITNHIEDIVWQADLQLRFIYVSPAVKQVLGYSPEEVLQLSMMDVLSDADADYVRNLDLTNREAGVVTPLEFVLKHKDGHWVPIEVVSSLVYSLDGNPMGYVGVARNITERKRIENTLRENEKRIKHLLDHQITVNQLGLAIGESLDLTVIYQTIYQHIQALADAWIFIVSSYDEESQKIRAEYAVMDGKTLDVSAFPPLPLAPEGRGHQSKVIHTGKPFYVPDYPAVSRLLGERYTIEPDGRVQAFDESRKDRVDQPLSALYVPMKAKGRIIGIMQLQSRRLDAYNEEDIQLLSSIASFAAVAIQNARLHTDVQHELEERKRAEAALNRHLANLEVLYQNGLKLARLVEKREIAQCIIDLLAEQLHWHHAVLRLSNPERDVIEVLGFSHTGMGEAQIEQERLRLQAIDIKPGEGITGWVWQTGKVFRSGCLQQEPLYRETYPGMKSGLYVPMLVADRVLGVITVESEEPDAFSEADERLLVTLAAQAAAAFDNARLYSETVQRLEELDALVQVSGALRTASGRAEMLPVILEQTMAVLHASGAAIAFDNEEEGAIHFELGAGELEALSQHTVPAGKGIIGYVLANGQPFVTQDITAEPMYEPECNPGVAVKAAAFAPLISQNRILGALQVSSQTVIEPNQVNLLQTIANIAANAIQRAALHERALNYAAELEQRVQERTSELRAANVALELASRSKDEFLASMSHELRTPLTGILNLSEVLQEQIYGPLNDKQLQYARTIEESGRHLLGLINDILDLSKIEAGHFSLQFDMVQLDMICQSSLQLVRGMANKKNQSISYTISNPTITMRADSRRMKQMLVNLLGNAVKFTPVGGQIGLDVTADEKDSVIHLTVWDTGIGIAREDFQHLFRPFSQIDASLSRQHEGTGLGLAIAQRLADKHGGSITLESAPQKGSRFTIHIPWIQSISEAEKTVTKRGVTGPLRNRTLTPDAPAQRAPRRLILADDNQTNVEIYAEYLRENGFEVILAGDGEEALDLIRQERPNLVLMDIQMPGMDGLTAVRQLRAFEDPDLAGIPVIALTALAMPGDRENCLAAGANEYLSKPVGLRELLKIVQSYIP